MDEIARYLQRVIDKTSNENLTVELTFEEVEAIKLTRKIVRTQ